MKLTISILFILICSLFCTQGYPQTHKIDYDKIQKVFGNKAPSTKPSGSPQKPQKSNPSSDKAQEEVRSSVNLKCLEQEQSNAEYAVTPNQLLSWIKKCRVNSRPDCQVYETQEDEACQARYHAYYPYELEGKLETQMNTECRIYLMKCPIQTNEGE